MSLLAQQRPLIEKYWELASQEIFDFKNGNAIVGAGVALPGQHAEGGQVHDRRPRSRARARPAGRTPGCWRPRRPHPNCAYMWMRYISTPKVQAEQAVNYGETPDNKLACPLHGQAAGGFVRGVPRQRAGQLLRVDRAVEDADRDLRQRQARTACRTRSGCPPGHRGQVVNADAADAAAGPPTTDGLRRSRPRSGAGRGRGPPCCSRRRWPGSSWSTWPRSWCC